MTVRVLALVLLLSLRALAVSGPADRKPTDPRSVSSPVNPQATPVPVDDLFYTRAVSGPAWSPDSKQIAFTTNLTGRYNLWKVAAAGGWPIQLSQSDERQYSAVWTPDGKSIVYQSDVGGHEYYDLFAVPAAGGPVTNLTVTPEISETDPRFWRDGKQLLVTWKPKTSSVFDLAVMDWATRKVRNLTAVQTKDHIWEDAAWSPDGRFVYASRFNAGFTDADLYRLDVATGARENLTAHQGNLRYQIADVSPDGKTVLLTADREGGYPNVALLDPATRKITWATDTQWEASASAFSPDGTKFAYIVNQDGRSDVLLAETATLKSRKLALPAGLNRTAGIHPFSPDGRSLLVSHQSSSAPADLWVYDLSTSQSPQLTFSAVASLRDLPPAQLVHYASFDGTVISAFLWTPFNLKRDGSHPAVVLPHGGPCQHSVRGQSRPSSARPNRCSSTDRTRSVSPVDSDCNRRSPGLPPPSARPLRTSWRSSRCHSIATLPAQ